MYKELMHNFLNICQHNVLIMQSYVMVMNYSCRWVYGKWRKMNFIVTLYDFVPGFGVFLLLNFVSYSIIVNYFVFDECFINCF